MASWTVVNTTLFLFSVAAWAGLIMTVCMVFPRQVWAGFSTKRWCLMWKNGLHNV